MVTISSNCIKFSELIKNHSFLAIGNIFAVPQIKIAANRFKKTLCGCWRFCFPVFGTWSTNNPPPLIFDFFLKIRGGSFCFFPNSIPCRGL